MIYRLITIISFFVAVGFNSAYAVTKEPLYIRGLSFEQLEYRFDKDDPVVAWDGDAYFGTDEWKLRFQTEGEYASEEESFETLENQALYQFPVSDFFDAKFGLRYDAPDEQDNRLYGVIGIQGLAPQWFEIDADTFISEDGKISARLDIDYELLITNRVILTPTLEANFAFSDDKDIGVGAGFSSLETGLRLSYDLIGRDVAPYIGINYERKFGQTADFSDEDEAFTGVIGIRLMF